VECTEDAAVETETKDHSQISLVADFSRQLPATPKPTSYTEQFAQFQHKSITVRHLTSSGPLVVCRPIARYLHTSVQHHLPGCEGPTINPVGWTGEHCKLPQCSSEHFWASGGHAFAYFFRKVSWFELMGKGGVRLNEPGPRAYPRKH